MSSNINPTPGGRASTLVGKSIVQTVSSVQGEYEVEKIHRQGYIIDENGDRILVGVAEWKNSLVKMEDTVYHGDIHFGLKDSDLQLLKVC